MAQQAEQGFRYWSFISYSHHDKRVARRLAQELARQRVPVQRRADIAGGNLTFSVFLDEQESGAGADLSAELRIALDASAKLIVICSPFAVASNYVAAEIRHFQSRGRSRDIICIVASGTPNATDDGRPQFECFPEPLRLTTLENGALVPIPVPERPLAVTLGHEADAEWASAVEQVSAGLLGISRTELRRLRDRHKLRATAWSAACVLALSAAVAAGLWAFHWPNSSYAHDFARRFGAWEELGGLSRSQALKRDHTFKFVRQGAFGRLMSVQAVNGHGRCPSETQLVSITGDTFEAECSTVRACSVEIEYTKEGSVGRETLRDQFGNAIETLSYSTPAVGILSEAVIGCSRTRTGIEFIEFERFENGPWQGLDRAIRFRGGDDKAARANQAYEFGAAFEYDESGRVTERFGLDEQGKRVVNKLGYSGWRRGYDADGTIDSLEFLDTDGKPILTTDGVAQYTYSRVPAGAWVRRSFGLAKAAVLDRTGVHVTERTFGPSGDIASIKYRDLAGQPTLSAQRFAEERREVNAGGFVIARSFFDAQSRPTPGEGERCYRWEYTVTDSGERISERCFDQNGKPANTHFGVHETRTVFDSLGNNLETSYWGTDGQPAFCLFADRDPEGDRRGCPVHRGASTYEPTTNNRIRVRFFDPAGKLSANGSGVAGWDSTFDMNGFETQVRYIGTQGAPRLTDGLYGYTAVPDRFNRKHVVTSLGADGNPAPRSYGVLTVRYEYDSLGREVNREYRDVAGEIVKYADSGMDSSREYDPFGNIVAQSWYPALNKQSGTAAVATIRKKFDRYQREIETAQHDWQGRLIANDAGHVIALTDYDPRGTITRVRYVDADRRAMLVANGTSGFDQEFDRRDRMIRYTSTGLAGNRQAHSDGTCIIEQVFDDRGLATKMSTHDCDGNAIPDPKHGVLAIHFRHDARGNRTGQLYFDASGKPMLAKEGVAGWQWQYDANNQVTVRTKLGLDGKPMGGSDGEAITRFAYDVHGFEREEAVYTANDELVRTVEFQRDGFGRERSRQMFSPDRQPTLAPVSGRAEARFEYDSQGHAIDERSYGLKGEPVNRKDLGWHRKASVYLYGELQEQRCFNVAGIRLQACPSED